MTFNHLVSATCFALAVGDVAATVSRLSVGYISNSVLNFYTPVCTERFGLEMIEM